jgi:hypothetical protein
LSAGLQADLDVRGLEAEEFASVVRNLQRAAEDQREAAARMERQRLDLQGKLEEAAIEQQGLRAQLRAREQELDDIISTQESNALELFKLRRELDGAARAAEQRGAASDSATGGASADGRDLEGWPEPARAEVRKLREEVERLLGAVSEREALEGDLERLRTGGAERTRRLALEAKVRAEEQERMLADLDASAQRIWEMTDAADRNAARFAASLAQLEVQKTKVAELTDEVDVLRNLLAAEQARALEQERMLASERAKMARAGLDVGGMIATSVSPEDVEDVFAGLGEPGARLRAPSAASSGSFAWADAAASGSLPIDDALADLDLGDDASAATSALPVSASPVSASSPTDASGTRRDPMSSTAPPAGALSAGTVSAMAFSGVASPGAVSPGAVSPGVVGPPAALHAAAGSSSAGARPHPALASTSAPVAASLSASVPSRITLGDATAPLHREQAARTGPRGEVTPGGAPGGASRPATAPSSATPTAVPSAVEDRAPGSGSRPLPVEAVSSATPPPTASPPSTSPAHGGSSSASQSRARMLVELVDDADDDGAWETTPAPDPERPR